MYWWLWPRLHKACSLPIEAYFSFSPVLRIGDSPWLVAFLVINTVLFGVFRRRLSCYYAPYDILFQQSRWFYLTDRPVLVDTFGTTQNQRLLRALEQIEHDELPDLIASAGRRVQLQPIRETFSWFIHRWSSNSETRLGKVFWPHLFAPPFHFQTWSADDAYRGDRSLRRVEIDFVQYFFDGEKVIPFEPETVLRVKVKEGAPRPMLREVPRPVNRN